MELPSNSDQRSYINLLEQRSIGPHQLSSKARIRDEAVPFGSTSEPEKAGHGTYMLLLNHYTHVLRLDLCYKYTGEKLREKHRRNVALQGTIFKQDNYRWLGECRKRRTEVPKYQRHFNE